MSLPAELANIFKVKQKSYKMVLILSMIETWKKAQSRSLPIDKIALRFAAYYKNREDNNLQTDPPPKHLALSWESISIPQTKALLETPIDALRSIIKKTDNGASLTFQDHIWVMGPEVLDELQKYANEELDLYNDQLSSGFSLKESIDHILQTYSTAKTQSFSNHLLGTMVRRIIPEGLRQLSFLSDQIKVQGSVGQGNWATVPWIALLDKRITDTTQHGEYVVYLFAEDMSAMYLTLNQGVTVPINQYGRKQGYSYLQEKVKVLREQLPLHGFIKDENIQLTSSGLGRDYQVSTVAYIRYDKGAIPEDDVLFADLENVMNNYDRYVKSQQGISIDEEIDVEKEEEKLVDTWTVLERIAHIKAYIQHKGFMYPDGLIENFYLSLKTKPFLILAGVSGTGKTKLVKLFAEALGATSANGQFVLIPVRPDWNDSSDLVGYKDLSGAFRPGRLAEVLCEASKSDNRNKPYFICLDEMNLARVEHYFSDLLSILETQEWQNGRIVTAPLIQRTSLSTEEDQARFGDLVIPDNVYFIGTVNMDETTHPFSKKVLDRANTIEFNYINLSQFPVGPLNTPSPIAIPNSFLRSEYLQLVDAYEGSKELIINVTNQLVKINEILEEIHAHVGFRIRDAVCFYMIYSQRSNCNRKTKPSIFSFFKKSSPASKVAITR
ncbi:MrcB family domain-containing protein [Gorillibacterium massiliense]|uniref:MrcB family domain-containing protein n=1 Tax=Gorillibacterium massiliense TaxID=1280390 RepID=UPI0004B61693|nr:DUF3578 domain-containing protein [Gorillibacterium massiliense]